MVDTNRKYYHFAWSGDSEPAPNPPQISAKERVAKILSETELENVQDLVFRAPVQQEKKSFLSGLGKSASQKDTSQRASLRGDHELFSIDDEDWMFDGEVNTEDGLSHEAPAAQVSHSKKPIYTPPPAAVSGSSRDAGGTSTTQARDAQFDTYIDDSVCETRAPATGKKGKNKVKQHQDGALLPMDSVDLEMELESDDDELIIGARPQLVQMDDISVDTTRDTQPIITVSQAELTEGAKSRRRKLNVLVIVGVVVLFLIVFGVSLLLLVYFSKA